MYTLLFINNFLYTTLVGSLGICLTLISKNTIFKNFSKRFKYYIWVPIIIRLLVPFKYTFTKEINIDNVKQFNFSTLNKVGNLYDITNSNNSLIISLFIVFWILGVLLLTITTVYKYFKLKNLLVDLTENVTDTRILSIYDKIKKDYKIKHKIKIRTSDCVSNPVGIGAFNSYIFIPNINYTDEQIRWILKHELMHFKSHDLIIKSLSLATKIIYWFNPLVYIMNRLIDHDCELCCDELVTNSCNTSEKKEYALTILESVKASKALILSNNYLTGFCSNKSFEKRIKKIFDNNSRKHYLIAFISALLIFSSFLAIKIDCLTYIDPEVTFIKDILGLTSKNAIVYSIDMNNAPEDFINYCNDNDLHIDENNNVLIGKKLLNVYLEQHSLEQ